MDFGSFNPAELISIDPVALFLVTMIDLVLAGDNAIVVGMAASRVDPAIRNTVIVWGMAGAVVLRILFALVATQLLAIVGLTLAGGILLLWVCWKMYRELVAPEYADAIAAGISGDGATSSTGVATLGFGAAISQIVVADVSMSLDNVLAVAGAAKGDATVLVIGLALSIIAMAIAANFIAKLLSRFPWIMWIGLLIIVYVALDMVWRGAQEVACHGLGSPWCAGSA